MELNNNSRTAAHYESAARQSSASVLGQFSKVFQNS
jgi:hypothetical protein